MTTLTTASPSRGPTLLKTDAGRTRSPADVTASLNPPRRTRLLTTLSFPLLLLLAVPFWWLATSIERLPLPVDRIAALSTGDYTARDIRTQVLVTADRAAIPPAPPGRAQYTHEDVLGRLVREVTKSADGILGQMRPHVRGKRLWDLTIDPKATTPLRIHIHRTDLANASFPLQPYIQPSHSVFTTNVPAGTCVVPVHPAQLGDLMLNKHYQIALIKTLAALFPAVPGPPPIPHNALKYGPNVTLSFVLLNEDASLGGYVRSWDIEGAIREHVAPHLEPLKDVFNFTIESQVLYHAPLSFSPAFGRLTNTPVPPSPDSNEGDAMDIVKDALSRGDEGWRVGEEDMKVFVNSEKWSLDSGSTNNPVLRFLLFVPSAQHRPMRLATPDSSDSFLIPQYGAVALLNPPAAAAPDLNAGAAYHLPLEALEPSFHLFTQSLYSLLALPLNPPYIAQPLPPSPLTPPSPFLTPLSPWQLEQVYRQRTHENSEEARKTLKGIVRLVSKIKEMKVGEGVRGKVLRAVESLERLDRANSTREAFVLARDAVGLANEAFFDPSMMGLLYFPDEHKFAVYTPLFAPVGIPMVVGLLKEFLAWKRRRKARRDAKVVRSRAAAEHAVGDGTLVGDDAASLKQEGTIPDGEANGEPAVVVPERVVERVAVAEAAEVQPVGRVLRSRRSTPAAG